MWAIRSHGCGMEPLPISLEAVSLARAKRAGECRVLLEADVLDRELARALDPWGGSRRCTGWCDGLGRDDAGPVLRSGLSVSSDPREGAAAEGSAGFS
jgi:hypothetical protein